MSDDKLEIGITFFANTDHSEHFVYAEHSAVQNNAAFVENEFKLYTLLDKVFDDFRRAFETRSRFFVVTEAEIYATLERLTVFEQFFHSFHKRNHMVFHIERPSAVDKAVFRYSARKRRIFPAFRICGNDVLMRQKAGGLQFGVFALKVINERVAVDNRKFRRFVNERKRGF